MKLLVKLKTGEEGFIAGYAPGRKGRPLAVVVVDEKLRAVKLRSLELIGYVKIREVPSLSVGNDFINALQRSIH